MKKIYFFAVILLALTTSCSKDDSSAIDFPNYDQFETNINFTIKNETISVGDTLWVSAKISNPIKRLSTGEQIDFTDAQIETSFTTRHWRLMDYNITSDAYKVLYSEAETYRSVLKRATLVGLKYQKKDELYCVDFGIVIFKTGVFSIDTDLFYYNSGTETNNGQFYGGGFASLVTPSGNISGELYSYINTDGNNSDLYNSLSDEEKSMFEKITENSNKYYFFKVE